MFEFKKISEDRIRMEAHAGQHIEKAVYEMLELAHKHGMEVECEFNGVVIVAKCGDAVSELVSYWKKEADRRRDEYLNSQEYKDKCRELESEERKRQGRMQQLLSLSPQEMKWKNKQSATDWKKGIDANTDGYGRAVYVFADTWARIMEFFMSQGKSLEYCALESSRISDDGITGFQYGCAVSILSQLWFYGDELREWEDSQR